MRKIILGAVAVALLAPAQARSPTKYRLCDARPTSTICVIVRWFGFR